MRVDALYTNNTLVQADASDGPADPRAMKLRFNILDSVLIVAALIELITKPLTRGGAAQKNKNVAIHFALK